MNLFIKSERKGISELKSLLERAKSIKNGYIIKEEIEEVKLARYSGGDINIKDGFYSLIVFNADTEIKITRDGKDLYFRQLSEKDFGGTKKADKVYDIKEKTYYLKGKYDKNLQKWWESAFSPEFDYPKDGKQDILHESRASFAVKIYRDEEGEVKYFRFWGYEVVKKEE
jgi:hypothetical protein